MDEESRTADEEDDKGHPDNVREPEVVELLHRVKCPHMNWRRRITEKREKRLPSWSWSIAMSIEREQMAMMMPNRAKKAQSSRNEIKTLGAPGLQPNNLLLESMLLTFRRSD